MQSQHRVRRSTLEHPSPTWNPPARSATPVGWDAVTPPWAVMGFALVVRVGCGIHNSIRVRRRGRRWPRFKALLLACRPPRPRSTRPGALRHRRSRLSRQCRVWWLLLGYAAARRPQPRRSAMSRRSPRSSLPCGHEANSCGTGSSASSRPASPWLQPRLRLRRDHRVSGSIPGCSVEHSAAHTEPGSRPQSAIRAQGKGCRGLVGNGRAVGCASPAQG